MSVVLDATVAGALYRGEPAVTDWYEALSEDLVTTPLVLAALEAAAPGLEALEALRRDLGAGALTVRWWSSALPESLALVREQPQLDLAGASLVALAGLLRTDRIATLDHPRFRPARTVDGEPFQLLP